MPNVIREAWVSKGARALLAKTSDPIIYTPKTGTPLATVAAPSQSEQSGAADRRFMVFGLQESTLTDASITPKIGDVITWQSAQYRVTGFDPDIYGWLTLATQKC